MYWTKPGLIWISPNFSYTHGNIRTASASTLFLSNPKESNLGEAIDSVSRQIEGQYARRYGLLYLDKTDLYKKEREISTDGDFRADLELLRNVSSRFHLEWKYLDRNSDDKQTQSVVYTSDESNNIFRNSITHAPFREWSVSPYIALGYSSKSWHISLKEKFISEYSRGSNSIILPDDPLRPLESYIVDVVNSYYSRLRSNANQLYVELGHTINFSDISHISFKAGIDMVAGKRQLKYQRDRIDTTFSRKHTLWMPKFDIYMHIKGEKYHMMVLKANIFQELPEMTRLIRTVDTNNPLNIYLGNPELKKSTRFTTTASYRLNNRTKGSSLNAEAFYTYYKNRISESKTYNSTTGVSTYQPVNVSGAYVVRGNVGFTTPFDRNQKLTFSTNTTARYEYLPDYLAVDQESSAVRTVVKNTYITEDLKLSWNIIKGLSASANFGAQWQTARSAMPNFTEINLWNFKAGGTISARLPWGLNLSTDFTYWKRTGYDDSALNKGNFVWNARLERTFLKGTLVAKIDAYDILGQISNVEATINSLGQTETWTNSMSRYVMLSLTYHFSLMPRNMSK